MVIKLNSAHSDLVYNYLDREPEYNLVLKGDINRFGFNNYFLNLWAEINNTGEIKGILLKYFEYILVTADEDCSLDGFCDLIKNIKHLEVSGKKEIIEKIANKIKFKSKKEVHFCKLMRSDKLHRSTNEKVKIKKIKLGYLKKIVKLYENVDEFDDTNLENIKISLKTGRGYCVEVNKTVVAMAKSTLECETHAMIVGVGTHRDYRNKGYATLCISKLCEVLLKQNKIPCLFYDNENAGKIYHRLGFEEIGKWMICNK